MNKVYRIVFNEVTATWTVVAETARSCGKRSSLVKKMAKLAAVLGMAAQLELAAAGPPAPTELPTQGQVAAGIAQMGRAGTATAPVLNIDQSSQRAVINWGTFNVGSAGTVNFNQPNAQAATLNRVRDANPSQIFGKINAPGQVTLINPAGVYFGKSAVLDVGAVTATTMSQSDANFMAGKADFSRNGATGAVVNEGTIRTALNGYVALLAPQVRNEGLIVAQQGTVVMAGAEVVSLNFDPSSKLASITVSPSLIATLVENKTAVHAPDGLIILSATAMDALTGQIINSGQLNANSLTRQGGRILLQSGKVQLSSTSVLNAKGVIQGGEVHIQAQRIENAGVIDVSGSQGPGGKVLIQASSAAPQTSPASIALAPLSQVRADGTDRGGEVRLESIHAVKMDSATVSVTSNAGVGGTIVVEGRNVTVTNSTLVVDGEIRGGQVQMRATPGTAAMPMDPLSPWPDVPTVLINGNSLISASSRRGRGGLISITGTTLLLQDSTRIDSTGASGGGEVYVGGGWQGTGDLPHATTVTMGQAVVIDASATENGQGGTVVLWSDIHNAKSVTTVEGSILAKGGVNGGNGGQVETSGRWLQMGDAIFVSTKSNHGLDGEWLLDPEHLWIVTPDWTGFNYTTTGTTTFTAQAANPSANAIDPGADSTKTYGPTVDGVSYPGVATLKTRTIVSALNSGNVRVLASGLIAVYGWQNSGISDYYINSTTSNKLTLEAGTTINFEASTGNKVVNLPNGKLELLAGTSITQASTEGGSISAGTLILGKCSACTTNPSVTLTNSNNQISNIQASNISALSVLSSTALTVNASNISSSGAVSLTSTSTVTLTGSITTTDTASGNVSIQATGLAGAGNVVLASSREFSVNQSGGSTYSGVISGAASTFKKLGIGALSLTGANTYSGGTLISAGTLQAGNGSSTGSLGSGNVTNNATLKFDLSADTTVANNISGTGTLEVVARFNRFYDSTSSSSLSNSAYETIATNTTVTELLNRISGGALHGTATSSGTAGVESGVNNKTFNAATNTGSFYILFQDGTYTKRVMVLLQQSGANVQAKVDSSGFEFFQSTSTALLNAFNAQAFNGDMGYAVNSGFGGYGLRALDRSAKITFTGNLTHTGVTTLTPVTTAATAGLCGTASMVCVRYVNPTMQVAGGLGNSAVTNNGNLIFANSSAQTYAGVLSGAGVVINNAAADLTLSGTNSFSGNVYLQAGKVIAGNNAAFGTAPIYQVSGLGSTADLNGKTIANNFYLLGAGTASAGALINGDSSNAATVSGTVTVVANSTLGGTGAMTLSGVVSASTNTVTFANASGFTATNTGNSIQNIVISNSALTLKTSQALSVAASSLSGATTLQTVAADKDITIAGAITNNLDGSSLTLMASKDIVFTSSVSGASGKSLNVSAYSDTDNSNAGGIRFGSFISTWGGHVLLGGGTTDTTAGCAGTFSCTGGYASKGTSNIGIYLTGATQYIQAGGGNITLRGLGHPTASTYGDGILLDSSGGITTTGTGAITLTGIATGEWNGIRIYNTTISAGSGGITLTGNSNSTGSYNGVRLHGSTAVSTTGKVAISGVGGTAHYGVFTTNTASISAGGDITINGQNAARNWGVALESSGTIQSTAGNISVTGAGTGGVYLTLTQLIAANNASTPTSGGNITINGTGSSNYGLQQYSGAMTAFGDITVTASSTGNRGSYFGGSGTNLAVGNITLNSTSTSGNNWGMYVETNKVFQSTAGNIAITSSGSGGAYIYGKLIAANSEANPTSGGTITINATGTSSHGLQLDTSFLVAHGAIDITALNTSTLHTFRMEGASGSIKSNSDINIQAGYATGSSLGTWGLVVDTGRSIQSTGGNITINARGSWGGFYVSTSATSIVAGNHLTDPTAGGNITLNTTGGSGYGTQMVAGSLVANGSISLTSTGGLEGAYIYGAGLLKANGDITIDARSTTTGNWAYYQSDSRFIQSTAGNISITATGGHGIYFNGGGVAAGNSTTAPTAGGSITINSTTTGSHPDGAGLRMDTAGTAILAYDDITIYSNAASAGMNGSAGNGHGILMWGSNQIIRSFNGDLSMTGYANRWTDNNAGTAGISGGITLYSSTDTLRAKGDITLKGVSMQGIGLYLTVVDGGSASYGVTSDTGNIVLDGLSNNASYGGTYIRLPVKATAGSISITGAGAGTGIYQDRDNGNVTAAQNVSMVGYSTGGYGMYVVTGAITSTNGDVTLSGYTSSTNTGHHGILSTRGVSATSGSVIFQGAKLDTVSTFVSAAGNLSGGVPAPYFAIADASNPAFAASTGIFWSGPVTANASTGYIQINSKAPNITGNMTAYGLALLGTNQSYSLTGTGSSIQAITASLGTGSLTYTNTGPLTIGSYGSISGITAGSVTLTAAGLLGSENITTTGAGTITLNPASGSYNYSGAISGGVALSKSGNGTQILSGNNTFTGATTISGGVLRVTNSGGLGTAAGGTTVSGGALELSGGITLADALTLSGTGISSNGAVRSLSGANALTGGITLGAAWACLRLSSSNLLLCS